MRPVSHPAGAAAGGFTLIEMMVVVAIIGVMLAIGVPAMSHWLRQARAGTTVGFYEDGLAMARRQAQSHNAASRIVFTKNNKSGQYDWVVDVCFPSDGKPCTASTGAWSTTALASTDDPESTAGYKSVSRSADQLASSDDYALELQPAGSAAIHFLPTGWVNTTIGNRVTMFRFAPAPAFADELRIVNLAMSLAGTAIKCDDSVDDSDSRACPQP
jgi:type IV fimbrial biogenesis protein FimT